MKHTHIDQTFIDNLPTPTNKVKEEYRADNLPKGFRIEIRSTSAGVGTFRFRVKGKDHNLGRTNALTLSSAIEKANAIIGKHDTNKLTLQCFWDQYFSVHAKNRLRTYRNYEGMWRVRIREKFGHCEMEHITPLMCAQFQDELTSLGLSGSHATGHLKLISRMFKLAIQWDLVVKNPCDKVEYMKFDNQEERFLTEDEQERLIEQLVNDKDKSVNMLILFLLVTGVRSGVAKTLQWSWFNRDSKIITVPASVAKNKKQNIIRLNDTALEILDTVTGADKQYVFVNPHTKRPYTDIRKSFRTMLKKADIKQHVRIHDLRHTFCSNLVSKNVSLATVQQLANHACYSTTLRYAKVSPDALHEACQVVNISTRLN